MGFNELTEDVLLQICARTAASSMEAYHNLINVSRSLRRLCEEPYVISRLTVEDFPLLPWDLNDQGYFNFLRRCCMCGNIEAICRHGFLCYFWDDQKSEGLNFLAKAADEDNIEAGYVLGVIFLCQTGEERLKGIQTLSSLLIYPLSTISEDLEAIRDRVRLKMWAGEAGFCGAIKMQPMTKSYIKYDCGCDGITRRWLSYYCQVLHDYGRQNYFGTCHACPYCIWDYKIYHLFRDV